MAKVYEWFSRFCTFLVLGGFTRHLITIIFGVTPWKWYDYIISSLCAMLFWWGIKKLGEESQKERR